MAEKNKEKNKKRRSGGIVFSARVALVLLVVAAVAVGITMVMYAYTQELLKERLQERLVAIASTAATQFDYIDIEQVRTEYDLDKPAMQRLVKQLRNVRDANANIQFAYLMRRTDDPSVVEFIADAMTLATDEELDENGNGIVDDEELAPYPGDPYEVDEYPVLRDEAFYRPAVDRELQEDQWGDIMAAYAPILDSDGNTVAIIGIDVLVDDFKAKTQATLLPFSLFVFVLLLLLAVLTILLIRFYGERVDALREVDRQKDELLSIVSHQLATPISSAKWYLEMLHDGDLGDLTKKQKEHVHTVQGVTESLADLVGMILDVSRIQLGKMQVDRSEVKLSEFFDEVINTISPKAKEKKQKFEVNLPSKLPTAQLDRRLMRMTLENLLSNAVKYTPEKGTVTLDVECQNRTLKYKVTDTGCGIPKEDQKKLFGKLFRASNVLNVDGNGFGLYVAKGAVESQGGQISFKSQQNKGTTFSVSIPLKG